MEQPTDLFETFKSMSIRDLCRYASGFNIFVTNGSDVGIIVGYLDLEQNSERVKVIVNGDEKYWDEDALTFVKAENRKWEKI